MKLRIDIPQGTQSPGNAHSQKDSSRSSVVMHSSPASSSQTVRAKLSSTRHLLEQTLNKKRGQFGLKSEPQAIERENVHNQLQKPNFEQLNHIYENYMKAPNKKSPETRPASILRCSSAPPVFGKKKEQLIQERELELKQVCTFKPSINKMPKGKNLDYSEKKFNREEWFKILTKPKTEVIETREKLKREKEDDFNRSCSFRPMISTVRSTNTSQQAIEDRLYVNENKAYKREQRKREIEDKEASSFPFAPQISESVAILVDNRKNQAPLYQRISEVQQKRNANQQKAKEKNEITQGLTFKPFISPKSTFLAANKCVGSVVDRLSRDTSQYIDKSSEQSITYTSTSSKPYNSKEFLKRQQEHLIRSQREKEELISKSTKDLLFKPTLNQNSTLIAYYKHNYNQESLDDKLNRISQEALYKNNKLKQEIHDQHYEKFSFEPKINPLSRQLAQSTDLSSYQDELKTKKKLQAEASLADLNRKCSFTPMIQSPKKYPTVSSNYSQRSNISKNIATGKKEKEKSLLTAQKNKEMQMLNVCTFKPKMMSRVMSEPHVEVKGADRFHELRNMAKKQQFDKQIREKKVLYSDMRRDLVYSPN